jgi:hypothetical protein
MVGAAVWATMVFGAACSDRSATPATTLAPIVTAVTTTSTTQPAATTSTRVPVVTLPPDTTTSTSTTTTTSTTAPANTTTSTTLVPRAAVLVLRDDGLGDALFGTAPDEVIAYVRSIIGAPTADSGWADPFQFGTCPGTEVRTVAWGDLTLFFGDESVVAEGRRHFFTWTYGPAFGTGVEPAGMITDAALGVGATVAQLRTAYPDVRLEPDDVLGPYFVVTDELSGTLSGLDDTDRVLSWSGGIPCGE